MNQATDIDRADVALTNLSGEQLRARIARARLYLIETVFEAEAMPSPELEREHLAFLHKLEKEGRLYGSGPLDRGASLPARELSIVAAASADDAQGIAAADPFNELDGFSVDVRAHTMNEGVACYVGRAISRRVISNATPFDADLSGVKLTREQFLARAYGASLQAIYLNATDKPRPAEDEATGIAHFVWLRENEMAAKLMSCGPRLPHQPYESGIWGSGLGIFATSRTEAERIASEEPSGVAGYRSLSVVGWTVNFGIAAPIAKALEVLGKM